MAGSEVAGHPVRLLREQELRRSFAADSNQIPQPPYSVRDVSLLYLLCSFDPAAARRAVPPGLELSEPVQGAIGMISVGAGWAIAPFAGCYAGFQVKGLGGLDGYPAVYNHTGFFPGLAGQVFGTLYNRRYRTGSAQMKVDGDRFVAEASCEGRPALRVTARTTDRRGPLNSGVNHYLGERVEGLTTFSVAFTGAFQDLDDPVIEILDGAPEPLRSLRPTGIVWPVLIDAMSMTYGEPRLLGAAADTVAADAVRATLLDLLSRIGRAAALVARTGRLLFLNAEAEALLGPPDDSRLLGSKAERRSLNGAILRTIERRAETVGEAPVVFERPDGSPLLATVLPVSSAIAAEPAALVLLTDPTRPGRSDPTDLLQLYGLSPAEARLARLVGQGLSPRDAAAALSVTTGTARTTLKAVYDKLGVGRQAQLAQIVARLEMV